MNETKQFAGAAAKDALEQLRRTRSGCLVVTDGARDLRLSVTPEEVSLEALGFLLQGGEPGDLIRAFLCALFWDDPTCLVEELRPGEEHPQASTLRLHEGVEALLAEMTQGLAELGELHRRTRGLEAQVAVRGDPPGGDPEAPGALLFQALAPHGERGEQLGQVVDQLPLDEIALAWAVGELLDEERALVRPAPLPAIMRRARQLEPLGEAGLVPGLRQAHLARLVARVERRRAGQLMRRAGEALLGGARPGAAVAALRSSLQHHEDDLVARELLAQALERAQRPTEARHAREELVELYLRCALPARARAHLVELDDGSPGHKQRLMDTALAMRDFAAAHELAGRLASGLSAVELEALPFRFAEAGAPEPMVADLSRRAGYGRRRLLRRGVWLLAALLLGAAGLAVREVHLRLHFRQAVSLARSDLLAGAWDQAGRHWEELGREAERAHLGSWPGPLRRLTCLTRVEREQAGIRALREDRALVGARPPGLDWRRAPDSLAARGALEGLLSRAASPALRAALERELRELDASRREVQAQVVRLRELVTGSRLDQALQQALELRTRHASSRDLWANEVVPLRVLVRPVSGARLLVEGQVAPPVDRGEGAWEVTVPIDGARGPQIRAEADRSLARELRLVLDDRLVEPTVWVRLFEVMRLVKAEPPLRAREPGLYAFEDEPVLQAAAHAVGAGELARPDLHAELAPALEPLLAGTGLRLSVMARGEVRQRRLYLTALDVFLEEPARAAAAEPRRIEVGRAARGPQRDEQGGWRLSGLACLGDDQDYLRDALVFTVSAMRVELGLQPGGGR